VALAQLPPPRTHFSPVPLMIGAVFFNANELFHKKNHKKREWNIAIHGFVLS
jgi:hypothetical protein